MPNCGKTNHKQACLTVLDSNKEVKFKFSMNMKRFHISESDKTVPVYYKNHVMLDLRIFHFVLLTLYDGISCLREGSSKTNQNGSTTCLNYEEGLEGKKKSRKRLLY